MKKYSKKKVAKSNVWKECCYVWYDLELYWKDIIVYYEWVIIEEKENTYVCEMQDQNIYRSKEKFKLELLKKRVKLI